MFNELTIHKKPIIGYGAFHNIYDYAASKGKIIKTKKNGNLNGAEMEIFQNNPKYFAHVYKFTPKYAIIEKLNTEDFREDVDKISKGIWQFVSTDPLAENGPYYIDVNLSDPSDVDATRYIWFSLTKNNNIVLKRLAKYCPQPLFNKWVRWFGEISNGAIEGVRPSDLDVHEQNFGYNKKGEIRFLDI